MLKLALVPVESISIFVLGTRTPATFATWSAAEAELLRIARQAVAGSIRTRYFISWADGETLQGRLELLSTAIGLPMHLQARVRSALAMTAGRFRPATMSREAQLDYLADQEKIEPGKASRARALLDHHQIGGAS